MIHDFVLNSSSDTILFYGCKSLFDSIVEYNKVKIDIENSIKASSTELNNMRQNKIIKFILGNLPY